MAEALKWLVPQALLWAGWWFGAIEGVAWAANVTRFAAWTLLLVSLAFSTLFLVAYALLDEKDGLVAALRKVKRDMILPSWFTMLVALVFALAMAGVGWFVTATGWVLASLWARFCWTIVTGGDEPQPAEATP